MEPVNFEQVWLKKYGEQDSVWKHAYFYNPDVLFAKSQKKFKTTITFKKKRYSGDLWSLDYRISLLRSYKLGFMLFDSIKLVIDCMAFDLENAKEYALNFINREHTQEIFKTVADKKLSLVQKRMKIVKINHDLWMKDWDKVTTEYKHPFLNMREVFTFKPIDAFRSYFLDNKIFRVDLWIFDYLISIEKAEKKSLISKEQSKFLRHLLVSETEIGLVMIRQPDFYRMLKSV